ncbi:N-acetyltransferase [Paenibacillus sp. OV219]|uniref:GNAT family N-acetyltransferase n=1 Tax=Paenibacillus sp. OV219 TaxID=1884377 RepID=UPI0008B6C947|nr:GNAT family N-acetyltransferase [Paenibacillus sp. OV219]SEO94084.1 Acetyltransferase (GNAT) family protein [Paenibacillus sp. OV219]
MEIIIRQLRKDEPLPYELLLLADPERQAIDAYIERSVCVVAEEDDGEIVGAYVLLDTRPKTVEIMNIAVREDKQGKGLGKRLIVHAIIYSKERGYKQLEIGTGNSSLGQLGLYQKCGFRIVSIESDYFVKHYSEPIIENGIPCRDMIRLRIELS